MNLEDISFREINLQDKEWIDEFITRHWGDKFIVVHNEVLVPGELKGFTAYSGAKNIGLITYIIKETETEIISLNSEIKNIGVGARLIDLVKEEAKRSKSIVICLTTTNDNLKAIEFYKNRGFILTKITKGAVDLSRKLKPGIPLFGENGIPIKDELVFQLEI